MLTRTNIERLKWYQKEGNGNLDIVFALFRRDKILHPKYFIIYRTREVWRGELSTYAYNRRVIRNGGLVLFDARVVLNSEILNVAAAENDIFVDLVRCGNLFIGLALSSFCAKGANVFERNGRFFRVDLVQSSNVTVRGLYEHDARRPLDIYNKPTGCRFWR